MNQVNVLKVVQKYLQPLGIEPEATHIYLELCKLGPSSALQLAKATSISRTQIYRYLETLKDTGLVSAEQLSYGTLFRSLPFENIDGLLAQREAETAKVKQNLTTMTDLIQKFAGESGPKATVQHYYGVAGLKQVTWNQTKAEKEYRTFEVAHLTEHLDKTFARRCRERYVERQLTSYDLTNASSVTAAELEPFDVSRTFIRHIDPKILTINFEMCIYNDVVAFLDYSKEQPMAIEIHHPTLKTMMQQLFDATWKSASPLTIS